MIAAMLSHRKITAGLLTTLTGLLLSTCTFEDSPEYSAPAASDHPAVQSISGAFKEHITEQANARHHAVGELFLDHERYRATADSQLQDVLESFIEGHPGTFGVSLVELDGDRRRAEYNPHSQFTAASTYKVYLGYSTLLRIDDGTLTWEDETSHEDKTIAECFEDMIALSDNPCSHWFRETLGRIPVEGDSRETGSRSFEFDIEDARATAADLTETLSRLETDNLPLETQSRETFLEALQNNVYREGIPAGSAGSVHNKVGFLNDFLHDAAIVRHPEGTYVLTILTENSSWQTIADLTTELETALFNE